MFFSPTTFSIDYICMLSVIVLGDIKDCVIVITVSTSI